MTDDVVDEAKIATFRTALSDWKRMTLFPQLNKGVSVNTCIEEAARLRERFARLLRGEPDTDSTLQPFLVLLGVPDSWSDTLRILLSSALLTDLLEYPLTFDTAHIENILEEKRDAVTKDAV